MTSGNEVPGVEALYSEKYAGEGRAARDVWRSASPNLSDDACRGSAVPFNACVHDLSRRGAHYVGTASYSCGNHIIVRHRRPR